MVQLLAVTDYFESLAAVESRLGLLGTADPLFFPEWMEGLFALSVPEKQRLDLIKQRYLYHRQSGHLLEGAVNFIVISPLLEMAGFYDPPFQLRSEATIRLELEDERGLIYQGRIDSLVLQEHLWIILVESKRTSFSIETALPQAIAYMAANPQPQQPSFGLVSNGGYSMFIKLEQGRYSFSEDFSLNRRRNQLYDVLQILNRLKTLV